jgi:hypothetical protein
VVAEPTYGRTDVTAYELFTAYNANEVDADRRYKGKRLVVSGQIERIGKDARDQPYVLFGGSGILFGVQAMFPTSAEPDLAALTPNTTLKVRCTIAGKLANVMRSCMLVS